MARVILQPCANLLANEHFEITINNPVSIQSISEFIAPNHLEQLMLLYPSGECNIWGVEPKKGGNIKQWEKINPGDVAFFARQMKIFASGVVTMKLHNRPLAIHRWDEGADRSTWEYIYFLKEIKTLSTPVEAFNQAVRYMTNKSVQGFSVLDVDRSELALDFFDIPATTEEDVETDNSKKLEARLRTLLTTDMDATVMARKEQYLLRKLLNGNKKVNTCGICLQEYPVQFIAAAHIKKRATCDFNERINVNIVMPMCKMGCDQLYEIGYISVAEGKVIDLHKGPTSAAVAAYLEDIVGNECHYYTEKTISFFEAHRKYHSNDSK